jgi:hypothetical protein
MYREISDHALFVQTLPYGLGGLYNLLIYSVVLSSKNNKNETVINLMLAIILT